MYGCCELVISARRDLGDPAEIEHDNAVADVAHRREIVRNEQVGQTEPLLQVHHQV